jgi:GTP cyclohydrolase I
MDDALRALLRTIGEDPDRPGLRATPERFLSAFRELTIGYGQSLEDITEDALFPAETSGMVIVRDIECYSLCEHHLLPFLGKVHVGYVPERSILGLSKIARVVDMFARRLQVQERLTEEIADALESVIEPKGLGVVVEADHLCTMMRGVGKQHSRAVTSCVRGLFKEDPRTREEFLALIGQPRN